MSPRSSGTFTQCESRTSPWCLRTTRVVARARSGFDEARGARPLMASPASAYAASIPTTCDRSFPPDHAGPRPRSRAAHHRAVYLHRASSHAAPAVYVAGLGSVTDRPTKKPLHLGYPRVEAFGPPGRLGTEAAGGCAMKSAPAFAATLTVAWLCVAPPCRGQTDPGVLYTLASPPSQFEWGCFGPCECPVLIQSPLGGSFILR